MEAVAAEVPQGNAEADDGQLTDSDASSDMDQAASDEEMEVFFILKISEKLTGSNTLRVANRSRSWIVAFISRVRSSAQGTTDLWLPKFATIPNFGRTFLLYKPKLHANIRRNEIIRTSYQKSSMFSLCQ